MLQSRYDAKPESKKINCWQLNEVWDDFMDQFWVHNDENNEKEWPIATIADEFSKYAAAYTGPGKTENSMKGD